jgi:hypothetical protein
MPRDVVSTKRGVCSPDAPLVLEGLPLAWEAFCVSAPAAAPAGGAEERSAARSRPKVSNSDPDVALAALYRHHETT